MMARTDTVTPDARLASELLPVDKHSVYTLLPALCESKFFSQRQRPIGRRVAKELVPSLVDEDLDTAQASKSLATQLARAFEKRKPARRHYLSTRQLNKYKAPDDARVDFVGNPLDRCGSACSGV